MGSILKVTAAWSGFTGSPGYSNFYWREADPAGSFDSGATAAGDAVAAFFTAIKALFPPAVQWTIQQDVPIIEETTGEITGFASGGARPIIQATATAAGYSAASGAVVTWRSGGVRNGRRVRGRTFLVPCAAGLMDVDGTLALAGRTTIGTAAQAYINTAGARDPVVWARPSAPGAADGIAHPIVSYSIPDKAAVLKSRRD